MNLLILLFCLLAAGLNWYYDRRLTNPIVLFNLLWGVGCFVSGLGLYGMFAPTLPTYTLYFAAILSFNLSALFFKKRKAALKNVYPAPDQARYPALRKLLLAGAALVFVLFAYRAGKVLLWISQPDSSFSAIRQLYFNSDYLLGGTWERLFELFVVSPFLMVCVVSSCAGLFHQKPYWPVILLTFACVGMQAFYTGGRKTLFVVFLLLLFSFLAGTRWRYLKLPLRLAILCGAGLLVFAMAGLTLSRGGEVSGIAETTTYYFTGSFKFFELSADRYLTGAPLLWGRGTLACFADIPVLILRFFGVESVQTASTVLGTSVQAYEMLSETQIFNAFSTMLFPMVADFGYPGAVLWPFLYGLLAQWLYVRMREKPNLYRRGAYLVIMASLFNSIISWDFITQQNGFALLFFLLAEHAANKAAARKSKTYNPGKQIKRKTHAGA